MAGGGRVGWQGRRWWQEGPCLSMLRRSSCHAYTGHTGSWAGKQPAHPLHLPPLLQPARPPQPPGRQGGQNAAASKCLLETCPSRPCPPPCLPGKGKGQRQACKAAKGSKCKIGRERDREDLHIQMKTHTHTTRWQVMGGH